MLRIDRILNLQQINVFFFITRVSKTLDSRLSGMSRTLHLYFTINYNMKSNKMRWFTKTNPLSYMQIILKKELDP